jgi:hypothetical protein
MQLVEANILTPCIDGRNAEALTWRTEAAIKTVLAHPTVSLSPNVRTLTVVCADQGHTRQTANRRP